MDCYTCENAAINACRRCAKTYCDDHGNAQYCADCLRPASALPSFNLYRGALLVLLVGTAVAVFLLVRPPGETRGSAPVFVGRTQPTSAVAGATSEVTHPPETPAATSTPAATATVGASPTPTEGPFIEYIVQEGDSLFSIAEAHQPANATLTEYAAAIASLNGLSLDSPDLVIGAKLLLPRAPAQ